MNRNEGKSYPYGGFKASAPDERFFEHRRRLSGKAVLALLLAAFVLLVLMGNLAANCFAVVRRENVPIRGLVPEFDGYTLLQISDLKGASFGKDQSRLKMVLEKENFDAVVITGDMLSASGNAEPFYALIEMLRTIAPKAPVYYIPGDGDPVPASMEYEEHGSAIAPWVLGAQQRGARLLICPVGVTRGEQTLWLATSQQLLLDLNAMELAYEEQYAAAKESGDSIAIELAKYNLQSLTNTRAARETMKEDDAYIALSHAPMTDAELNAVRSNALFSRVRLLISGHYLGGLVRLPLLGPVYVPTSTFNTSGLFVGAQTVSGLTKRGGLYSYVSAGLGSTDARYPALFFRLFNPPSVTLLTLSPSVM